MAIDLDQFSEEPIDFTVEFQGKTLQFYLKAAALDEFFASLKRGGGDPKANMRRTFQELLLDDEQRSVTKEWIDRLMTKPNLIPLGIKINAAINSALGLDDIATKKG